MSKKSCYSWLAFPLWAVACAGCGRHSTGLPLVADARTVKMLRESSAAAEPAKAEVALPAVAPTEWADLTGQFSFDGSAPTPEKIDASKEPVCDKHGVFSESLLVGKQNGLKNVVVFVAGNKKQKLFVHPDYEASAQDKLRFDNKDCRFEPHILPMRISQTLELHNSDAFSHNSAIERENPLLGKDSIFDYRFEKPKNEPVPVTCSIHTWMKGYVIPRDNPYVAVTDDDGRFKIEKMPPGMHEFVVWHERAGKLNLKAGSIDLRKGKFKWDVKPGANDLGEIQLPAAAFQAQ